MDLEQAATGVMGGQVAAHMYFKLARAATTSSRRRLQLIEAGPPSMTDIAVTGNPCTIAAPLSKAFAEIPHKPKG